MDRKLNKGATVATTFGGGYAKVKAYPPEGFAEGWVEISGPGIYAKVHKTHLTVEDRRLLNVYRIIDTALPPNTLHERATLLRPIEPGCFEAVTPKGERVEVWSCQLKRIEGESY